MRAALLAVHDLRVHFPAPDGAPAPPVRALDGLSLDLDAGDCLGIVGETGAGKTTLARALLGLHPPGSVQGSIRLAGRELVGLDEAGWRPLRWRRIALAVQNAGTAFDPAYRIDEQIAEPLRQHLHLAPAEARARAAGLARQVGLEARHLRAYPHQLSGGEKQRALLAMALCCAPQVLVLDEPFSGQDVLARAGLIELLRRVQSETEAAMLLISHDLAAVSQLAARAAVLYAGRAVEVGPAGAVLETPRHPYAWGLVHAYPVMTTARDLQGIRGQLPDPANLPAGCPFHPRCTQAVEVCRQAEPPLQAAHGRLIACHLGGLQTLLAGRTLFKTFSGNGHPRSGNGNGAAVEAVRGADIDVLEGEVVALVGQTGSGKTTLGRLLVGLEKRDGGMVLFQGQDLLALDRRALSRRVQFIAQDPFDAVSPRLSVAEIVREPLDVQAVGGPAERRERAAAALRAVSLPEDPAFLSRRPHELSGGQLQRLAIARALVLDPKLLVADEPVSMLDASEQAKVLNLLKALQNERGMGLLLISHDLALVRKVADRLYVMRDGQIVESGPTHRVIAEPQHAYTRALLQAAPAFLESI